METVAFALTALTYYHTFLPTPEDCTENEDDENSTPSILSYFKSLTLDAKTSVEEANQRRTASYYEKAREAHDTECIRGVTSSVVVELRREELRHIFRYKRCKPAKSHRTIVAMCDERTQGLFDDARQKILDPLRYSSHLETDGVWIPKENVLPNCDMHVTIALPWWWHTIRDGNENLSKEVASRFRKTLLLEFHYPFQIEFERFVLLGGKVLVALWRCVGERTTEDGTIIFDRHGDGIDPMLRLRAEIVRCFTTSSPDRRRLPLTHAHKMEEKERESDGINSNNEKVPVEELSDGKVNIKRYHTIEKKTPGYSEQGIADGFIHTTLCRLPSNCLSTSDVELGPIHRLCREASATLSGHRMLISTYRFLETTGEGGESNPCVNPIYEEIIDAPRRHNVLPTGKYIEEGIGVVQTSSVPLSEKINLTIGPEAAFWRPDDTPQEQEKNVSINKLFENPNLH